MFAQQGAWVHANTTTQCISDTCPCQMSFLLSKQYLDCDDWPQICYLNENEIKTLALSVRTKNCSIPRLGLLFWYN